MLKGIEKNFQENYAQIINRKRKDQLKTKEDVSVSEAFELYMLKNFHKIKLNPLTTKMLNFWEKDFEDAIEKHKEFLLKNLEDQNIYSSKFSEILEEMDIFQSEDEDERKEENQDQGQDNPSNEDENNDKERYVNWSMGVTGVAGSESLSGGCWIRGSQEKQEKII